MQESKEEMQFLYDLQRKHEQVPILDSQQAEPDAAYLDIRPCLLKIIVAVADYHNVCQDAVYLAASLLDAYRAKSLLTQSTDEKVVSLTKIHTFALAGLVSAASYIDGGGAVFYKLCAFKCTMTQFVCRATNIPLSHYTSSWMQQSKTVVGDKYPMTADELKQAQPLMANVLDWRFNRATADRFLSVFITRNFLHASLSTTESRQAYMQEYVPWTRYFCESAVMNNISCHYAQSSIAAASIFAARSLLYDESLLPDDLDDVYGIKDQHEFQKCIDEMLHYHNKRSCLLLSPVSHSASDVVEEDDFAAPELHCIEDINSTPVSPTADSIGNVICSTPQTMPPVTSTYNTPRRQATPHVSSFVWDSPPLWISPSIPHAEPAFLRLLSPA
jgi:hypothetical protein